MARRRTLKREGNDGAPRPRFKLSGCMVTGLILPMLGLAVLFFIPAFWWYGCRIDVGPGEFMPLLKKTGKDMTNDMILAPTADFKGPQFEILKEGRHFRNPYTWYWSSKPLRATVIPKGKVGIMVRKFGRPLPSGDVLARESDQKGIVPDPVLPGRHYINTWAYDVEFKDMVRIEPGHMGVVTLLVGPKTEGFFGFVSKRGHVGPQPYLLPPGTHPVYSNPYVYRVTPIDVRSHKLEMAGPYSIRFPSKYGFDIKVEGTIEWAPDLKKLPELFVKFVDERDLERSGGINNIQQRVILPYARSFFRTVGGSYRAVDFITGSTRAVVQHEVRRSLRRACASEGIEIKSVVIKATKPPVQIRKQYERREIARRNKDRFEKEIEMEIGSVVLVGQKPKVDAKGKLVLDKQGRSLLTGGKAKMGPDGKPILDGGRLKRELQKRRQDREVKLGKVRSEIVRQIREAEQYQAVEVTQAKKQFEVAKIELEAAKDLAAAVRAKGKAEADVMVMNYRAEAEGVRAKVSAFGNGTKYSEYALLQKLAPGIQDVLSNTDGLFARLFERFVTIDEDANDGRALEASTNAPLVGEKRP